MALLLCLMRAGGIVYSVSSVILFRSGAGLMTEYYGKANIGLLSSHVCNLLGYKEHARLLITEGCQLSAKPGN